MTPKQLPIIHQAIFIFYFFLTSSCLNNSSSPGETANKTTHQADVLNNTAKPPAQPIKTELDSIASQHAPATMHQADLIPEIDNTNPHNRQETINELPLEKRKIQVPLVKPDEQAIVLLHGLNRISFDFQIMKKRLAEAFPKATIIALESVNKDITKKGSLYLSPTVTLSIEEQADKAYQEIKEKLGKNKKMVIIGHSQGGLRGFALAKNHAKKLSNEAKIDIKKLITIGTPWKGAPVIQHICNQAEMEKTLTAFKPTLKKIDERFPGHIQHHILKLPKTIEMINRTFPFLYRNFAKNLIDGKILGSADLKPDSDFIRNYVGKNLKNFTIPISAIAGVLTDFSQIFDHFTSDDITQSELEKLNHIYARLIGGSADCEHDMLLPVDTQQAIGVEKNNFECIKIMGTCHGNKVGMPVKKGVPELHHETVIKTVIALITDTFYTEETEAVAA